MTKKMNGLAKWIFVAIAIGGIIFNTAILYSDVRYLKADLSEVKQDVKAINAYLLHQSNRENP